MYRALILLLVSLLLSACTDVDLPQHAGVNMTSQFATLELNKGELGAEQIMAGAASEHFVRPPEKHLFGNTDKVYWYKATLPNTLFPHASAKTQAREYIFEIPYPLLDKVNIWFRGGDGQIHHEFLGTQYPFVERTIKSANLAVPIPAMNPGEPLEVLFSVNTNSLMTVAAFIWDKNDWQAHQQKLKMWYGFLFGSITILIFYNLFLAISLRDSSYLYYILYLISLSMVNAINAGLGEQYLSPNSIGMSTRVALSFVVSTTIFGLLFVNRFLDIRHRFPRLWRASIIGIVIIIPPAIPELLGYFNMGALSGILTGFVLLLTNVAMIYYFVIAILSYRAGAKEARFVIVAFSMFAMGYYLYQLFVYQGVAPSILVVHMLEIGMVIEGLILSLALADRFHLVTEEKQQLEEVALENQRTFSKRLIQAQEAEREAFSNTMHDSIGHGLLVLKQNLEQITNGCQPDTSNPEQIAHFAAVCEQAGYCGELLDDVRHMSHDLHPHLLKRLGLKTAIESTLERAFSAREIEWQADVDDLPDHVEAEREITLYRVIQESLNNILKHADASEVMLTLEVKKKEIIVNIKDDGQGFSLEDSTRNNFGLNTMKGRITLFGGWFNIQSNQQSGTHLSFGLPIE